MLLKEGIMSTDIEIADAAKMQPITEIAAKLALKKMILNNMVSIRLRLISLLKKFQVKNIN